MIVPSFLTMSGFVLAGALGLGVGGAPNPAREILERPQFGFCHDPDYPLLADERGWCPLVGKDSDTCPSLPKACKAEAGYLDGPPGRLSTRHASDDGNAEAPKKRGRGGGRDRARVEEKTEVTLPALGGIAQLLFWAVIIGGVLALLLAIFRNRRTDDASAAPAEPAPDGGGDGSSAATAQARRAMETDVDRLLAMARDAAAQGQYSDAVDYGHAALLRRLDHENLIRLHRSRTNGDYVRQLRGQAGFFAPVRDALRAVDRAQFGTTAPDRGTYEAIIERVSDIVRKAGPLVLLLGLFGLACDGIGTKSYPWRYSPSGSQGVLDLLQESGVDVRYRTTSMDTIDQVPEVGELDERPRAIVMLSDASATEAEWSALYDWVSQSGGTLVIAGGAIPPWLPASTRIADPGMGAVSAVELSEESLGSGGGFRPWFETDVSELSVPRSSFIDGPGKPVLVREGQAYGVMVRRGGGRVFVLADDYLFKNASLVLGDNAAFVQAWLGEDFQLPRVEFVDAWAQAGAADPMESMANSHLTPALIQVLLFVLILYLWRGRRFGLLRDPKAPSRRAFVQHARAMGHLYQRARANGHATSSYASWVLDRLRDQFPIGARSGLSGLAAAIAHRSGRDETDVVRLLVQAHDAADPTSTSEPAAKNDLTLVRDLGRLLRAAGGHK